jgi:hypothetical protein
VYVHVFDWPGEVLVLPAIERRVLDASVLGGGKAGAEATARGLALRVAPAERRETNTVVRLRLDGPADALAAR